jgi:hypothetical protein
MGKKNYLPGSESVFICKAGSTVDSQSSEIPDPVPYKMIADPCDHSVTGTVLCFGRAKMIATGKMQMHF